MRSRQRQGANALEFALILPVFVLVLGALMDYGWLFFQQSAMDTAVTVGCRAGALVDPGDADTNIAAVHLAAEDAMRNDLLRSGGGDCATCTTEVYSFGSTPGRSLMCSVSQDYIPLLGMVPVPDSLDATIAVRMEWQREETL